MIAQRFVRLIESHADRMAEGLVGRLQASEKTADLRKVPAMELKVRAKELYQHLGEWLLDKTEADIERRYLTIGRRRSEQGITLSHELMGILTAKEHMWQFLEREGLPDRPVELLQELTLLRLVDQFFDRAVYYTTRGYELSRNGHGA